SGILLLELLRFVGFVFCNRHLIALGRKRILHVLAKSNRKDSCGAVCRVVELDRRNLRRKLAVAQVVKIITLRIPRGTVSVERFIGDSVKLAIAGAPDEDRVEARLVGLAESQEVTV